jgi:integrase
LSFSSRARRGDLNMRRGDSLLQTSLEDLEQDLKRFETFCRIDKNISALVTHRHCLNIRNLYQTLNYCITKQALRQYLLDKKITLAVKTYANILCSMKRYFRTYQGSNIADSFEFPKIGFSPTVVPSKQQLQTFFKTLPLFPRENQEPLPKYHALFLLLASSGLRLQEALSLTRDDIYPNQRMVISRHAHETSTTKMSWVTFYNTECAQYLVPLLNEPSTEKLFPYIDGVQRKFRRISRITGIYVTAQVLRRWFNCEMGRLGVPDRYVDAFCGRTPKSVLAKHYTQYGPECLKEIYDNAGIKVLTS